MREKNNHKYADVYKYTCMTNHDCMYKHKTYVYVNVCTYIYISMLFYHVLG